MYYDINGFGKELRSIRKDLNLTIEEVSFLAGINEKTIYRIEYGKNKISTNTLDSLSIAYKKNLFDIYNKYALKPQIILSNLITKAEENLYVDDVKGIGLIISKLKELKLGQTTYYENFFIKNYIKLLEATYVDIMYNDRSEAIKLLFDSIKSDITDFKFMNYKNFNYSPIEKRVLMNLSTMSYDKYNDEIYIKILNHLSTLLLDDRVLYPKLILNLSTMYHKKNNFNQALALSKKGITYCINNKSVDVLPKLFFRKFASEIKLDINDYKDSINKALFMAEINNQEFLKHRFKESAEGHYGIILTNS